MKNKKWKRKAKRIIGKCLASGCKNCEHLDRFISEWNDELTEECGFVLGIPPLEGYRRLENNIKKFANN